MIIENDFKKLQNHKKSKDNYLNNDILHVL